VLPFCAYSFGSFEVCKGPDPVTSRPGPSQGLAGPLLLPLLGYTIKHHYSGLWQFYGGGQDLSMADMDEGHVRRMVLGFVVSCVLSIVCVCVLLCL
jgi:hypothetical protein